jgi:hypothetical protein
MHEAFGMTHGDGLAKDMCWRKQGDGGQDQCRALPAPQAKEISAVYIPATSVGISFVVRKHGYRLEHEMAPDRAALRRTSPHSRHANQKAGLIVDAPFTAAKDPFLSVPSAFW